jgi:Cysteine-rich CWC
MSAPASLDSFHCPLCGQPNRCAMEMDRASGHLQPPCWCTQLTFGPALLERVAPQARGLACICRACATDEAPPLAQKS